MNAIFHFHQDIIDHQILEEQCEIIQQEIK